MAHNEASQPCISSHVNYFDDIVKVFVCMWAIRANNTSGHRTMSSFLDTTFFYLE